MVDLGLSAVGKVAELGFPKDEHFRAVERVAVVEAEDGGFGEGAVVHAEGGLVFREVLERDVTGTGAKVVNGGMALAKSATAAVLTGKADRDALREKGGEGEVFSAGPIEGGFAGGHGLAGVEKLPDLGVNLKIGRNGGDGFAEVAKFFGRNGGRDFFEKVGAADRGMEFGVKFADGLAGFTQGVLGYSVDAGANFLDLFFRDDAGI